MGDGPSGTGSVVRPDDYRELYTQVCESYRAIDDFRMKLLGLLPVATGAGVLVLLNSGKVNLSATGDALARLQQVLVGVALFGMAVTLGLFAYELHGIKKCGRLIKVGARIESRMGTSGRYFGQFATRPHRVARHIDVPFASSVVYPASLAVWVFMGLVLVDGWAAVAASGASLIVLALGSVWGCRRLDKKLDAWDQAQELLHDLAKEGAERNSPCVKHRRGGRSDEEANMLERRCRTTRVFLAAMLVAENPGTARLGPRLRRRRGWALDPPVNAENEPSPPEQARAPALYLCTDGEWWSRENGRFERLGDAPATLRPERMDTMLKQVLSTHDLRWPGH